MQDIGIGDIGVALPEERIDAVALGPGLGIEPERLERRLGFRALARMPAGSDASDLGYAAVQALTARGFDLSTVQCLCVVTQNPDGAGIPQVSTILHGRLGLGTGVATFDIGHGCAGFVYGLAIARSFMQVHGFVTGLLVTTDPYSKIVDPSDPHTALIFGDGAAATVLTHRPRWRVGQTDFGSNGATRDALYVDSAHRLHMNGKRIARLASTVVPDSIRATLKANGLTLADVDEVLLHQGSRYIVETIGDTLGARDRTHFYAAEYGNLVSSSLPVVLAQNVGDEARRVVLCGFGVGLAWATTVLTRVPGG
jgi:3-oxoacyl-[acyl-carrier-protein] synthase III